MTDAEKEIRALVAGWVDALHAKDVAARTADHAADVHLFDVLNPLQHKGIDALRGRLADWFATFQGPISCDVDELEVTAGEDVAFCHSVNRFRGTTVNGPLDMRVRFTTCFRRVDGRWLVTHEHASAPIDG